MNRELYIHTLSQFRDECKRKHMDTETEAFNAAIQALSADGDCISRQAAIDAMATWDWQELYLPTHFKQLLEELPSAQSDQLESCPIYGGVCGYPSDHCYECPNHHDTKVANGMALPYTQRDDFDRQLIALRIKCALGDTGYSQRELSEMTGITQVTISRYANGLRIPSATNLKAIADALGVGIEYFFAERRKDGKAY